MKSKATSLRIIIMIISAFLGKSIPKRALSMTIYRAFTKPQSLCRKADVKILNTIFAPKNAFKKSSAASAISLIVASRSDEYIFSIL